MKSKKGSVELIFIVLVGLMVWAGSGRTDAEKAQGRIDVEKSFGQPKGNVLVLVDKLSEKKTVMNEFDRTGSSSQVNEVR
jgi:hypothetical protein